MRWMLMIALVSLFALPAFADVAKTVEPVQSDAQVLNQQMKDLILEREAVLTQMEEEARLAPLSERVAREAQYAEMQVQYEIQLLDMMVEYYDLVGNEQLRLRAEANLAQILAPKTTGTPESENREGR